MHQRFSALERWQMHCKCWHLNRLTKSMWSILEEGRFGTPSWKCFELKHTKKIRISIQNHLLHSVRTQCMNETCAYECLCLGMHECVLGCAVIVFVKCTFGDTWNWDMKAWGAIKVTDISVLGVTHGLRALPRAPLLLANLHLGTALSWPVDAFAICCVWLVQVGYIPHICQFWHTTTICKPEKAHQKCVNLRQNWPEWAKILCSPC